MLKKIFLVLSFVVSVFCFNACEEAEGNETGSGSELEGAWYLINSAGCLAEVKISGSSCVITKIYDVSGQNSMSAWVSAVNKRIVTKGDVYFTNLTKTGTGTWKCNQMSIYYTISAAPEATHFGHLPSVITKQSNGDLYLSFTETPTLRSGWLVKSGCSNAKEYDGGNTGGGGGNTGGGGSTTNKGTITVWTDKDHGCGYITVTITGVGSKTLTNYYSSGTPDCGDNGTASFPDLPYGTYTVSATCGNSSWPASNITLSTGCHRVKLN